MNYVKKKLDSLILKKNISQLADKIPTAEAKTILAHADELMQQTFTFNRTWDMERCLTPYTLSELDWNTYCNDDPEWCFMLNRMSYLDHLILASLLTGDRKYANKAKFFILDWIAAHPDIVPEPSTRTLDTGMRVMNWLDALPYFMFLDCLTDSELQQITNRMLQQMRYLKTHYLPKYKTSNWGSIQTCSIVSVLPFLSSSYASDPLYQWAKSEKE